MIQKVFQEIGGLFESIDQSDFPEKLISFIGNRVAFDCSIILAFEKQRHPLLLFDDLSHKWRKNSANDYLVAAYLLDPFYIAAGNGVTGIRRIEDVAPDGFQQSEYFRTHYINSHVCDEVCYLIPVEGNTTLVISIARKEQKQRFSREDIEHLKDMHNLISKSLNKFWALRETGKGDYQDQHRIGVKIQDALALFGSSVLSPRECEVVRLLLRGHSNNSIAGRLGISAGTVKIHREKIYSKLDICSQSELFHLFIDSVSAQVDSVDVDPLQNYIS